MRTLTRRALGVAAGLALDQLLGEPPDAMHPVAAFGTLMTSVEQRLWTNSRATGVVYTALGVGTGLLAGRLLRFTSVSVALAVAGRQLRTVAAQVGDSCNHGNLVDARAALPALVGRDPSNLDKSGISAAVIESVAENTVDAVIAPAFWGLVAGAPGAAAYRAINTMDAMVGHRSERYENFGWAAARLDDVANYVPARLFGVLVLLAAPVQARSAALAVTNDAHKHPSPNAGVAEASVAGSLGIQLGGPLQYGERHEDRPTLGAGHPPEPTDIPRAIQLAARTEALLGGTVALVGAVAHWRNTP